MPFLEPLAAALPGLFTRTPPVEIAVVAIVKDEAHGIFEWLAHHAALGVQRFYIYENGSTDGTQRELAALPPPAEVRIIDWPMKTGQLAAYRHALTHFGHECRWMAFIDADEFIMPLKGEALPAILADFRHTAGLALPWACFGSSGHDRRPAGTVLESYLHRAPDDNHLNGHVKSIVDPRRVWRWVRNPHVFLPRLGWSQKLDDGSTISPRRAGLQDPPYVAQRLRLNHYVVKSREDFEIKAARGRVSTHPLKRDAYYFELSDRNEVFDDSALPYAAAVHAAIARRAASGG